MWETCLQLDWLRRLRLPPVRKPGVAEVWEACIPLRGRIGVGVRASSIPAGSKLGVAEVLEACEPLRSWVRVG